MEKIFKRVRKIEKVVQRKQAKIKQHKVMGEAWDIAQNRNRIIKGQGDLIRQDRVNRRVDWETGPLAPRRDVGDQAETYGTLSVYDFALPDRTERDRPKFWPIVEGDRVVITRGPDMGKIGRVSELNKEKVAVQVAKLNMIDINIPDWLKKQNQAEDNITSIPQMLRMEHVKLVYPLPDPETGIHRDVVIDRLVRVPVEGSAPVRAIPGTNTIIPWPETTEPEYEDNPDDTLADNVKQQTFRPALLGPVMPLSVIDELRNKYSRFRTRHDWDYIQKKEAEAAKDEKRKTLINTMRTPLQELAALRAQQKAAQDRELTAEQLAKIGEVIAQEQARTSGNGNANAMEQQAQVA